MSTPNFAIGVWNQPPENFAAWKARGCNFVMGMDAGTAARFSAQQFSDLAASAGLSVMLNTDFRAPNLVAWFVPIDEPNAHATPIPTIKAWVDKFTALDATLPIVISIAGQRVTLPNEQGAYYQSLAALSPKIVLTPDWYICNVNPDRHLGAALPEGWNGMAVRKLREWCPANDCWMFAECSYQGLKPNGDAKPREPTADEMELQIKQGIAAGAKGLVYFPTATGPLAPWGWPERYNPPTSTEIPSRMVAISQRLNPPAPEPSPPDGPSMEQFAALTASHVELQNQVAANQKAFSDWINAAPTAKLKAIGEAVK